MGCVGECCLGYTDIIINFRTGFVDENGRLEMRPRLIARQYSRRWLVVDVVSCLPIAYVTQIMEANSSKSEGGGTNVKIFKVSTTVFEASELSD